MKGIGFTQRTPQDVLCCSLVRYGKSHREPLETAWMETRFAHKCDRGHAGYWTVDFDVMDAATYLFTCHAFDNGDAQVIIKIDKVEGEHGLLAFSPGYPKYSSTDISAQGTVLNSNNQVSCSLTPINCNTGVGIGKAAVQVAKMTNKSWSVDFHPGPFSGCYLLQATAGSEGSIYASFDVP